MCSVGGVSGGGSSLGSNSSVGAGSSGQATVGLGGTAGSKPPLIGMAIKPPKEGLS